MRELVHVLGWPSRRGAGQLVGLFLLVGMSWVGLVELLGWLTGWGMLSFHVAGWVGWFVWQGSLFPRRRRAHLVGRPPVEAYRRAFFRDVLPGVTFGAAQMFRPLAHGTIAEIGRGDLPMQFDWLALGGWALFVPGVVLLVLGFSTIGAAAAGFLYEYVPRSDPLRWSGIYALVRHPLFLGGGLASLGGSLILGIDDLIALGLVNALAVPVYGRIEDRRLALSFGQDYQHYRQAVGRFVPRPSRVRATLFPPADRVLVGPGAPGGRREGP